MLIARVGLTRQSVNIVERLDGFGKAVCVRLSVVAFLLRFNGDLLVVYCFEVSLGADAYLVAHPVDKLDASDRVKSG